MQLGAPPPPTDLNVTVNGSAANISWNPPARDERYDNAIDFYRVEVYALESGSRLYLSHTEDTWEQLCLQPTTSELRVNVTTINKCGQSSEIAATNFTLEGK